MSETRSSSWGTKIIAAVVLLVAAWVLLKVVIGIIATVAWVVVAVLAVVGVLWAYRTLSS